MSESSDKNDDNKKKDKRGILRLDINKPRNSAGSVEFRDQPELLCEVNFSIFSLLKFHFFLLFLFVEADK